MGVAEPKPARGSMGLYAAAFGLMVAGGLLLVAASLGQLRSTRLLWVSAWLSVAAIVVAALSLLLPRRR